jgi:hypothetical protein
MLMHNSAKAQAWLQYWGGYRVPAALVLFAAQAGLRTAMVTPRWQAVYLETTCPGVGFEGVRDSPEQHDTVQ